MMRLFPVLWSVGFGVGTVMLWVAPDSIPYNGVPGGAPPEAKWLLLAAWVAGTAMCAGLVAMTWRLKRVRVEDDTLLVSDFRREVRVPLRDVVGVRQPRFPVPGSIAIDLARETPFGREVTFFPQRRGLFGAEGPTMRELRALVSAAGALGTRAGDAALPRTAPTP